jgi:hypothetical protein
MPAANVIQLRQLLKEKLPGLRQNLEGASAQRQNGWKTGLTKLDAPLQGGLPKSALTEIVAAQRNSGSALLRNAFLRRAAGERQIITLVDGSDSFDATQVEEAVLSRLLWVRCRSAEESLKAADLLLRDQNVSLVLLDLIANPAAQLRRIPATTWFRFQRLIEQTSTVCLVFTPQPMIASASVRITLSPARFSLDALDREPEELLNELKFDVVDARRSREAVEHLRSA